MAASIVAASLLASCTSTPQQASVTKKRSKEFFAESEYGVKASPRVTNVRSNLPRGGGRDQVGKPYQVKGKWYYPKEDRDYRKVGGASWYGDAFHGRLTANGEIYDMTHLTAAHPTMPLPSYARVTNLKNGNSLIVRVNDRGPYHTGRIIDLSHKAAEMLDYAHAGMSRVEVEYVGRAPLDGNDEQFLVASYRPGSRVPDPSMDGLPSGVMIAMNGNSPSIPARAPRPSTPFRAAEPAAPAQPVEAVAAGGGVAVLPDVVPVAAERPAKARKQPARPEVPTSFPFAFANSYAAQAQQRVIAAFESFDGSNAEYIAAGTFSSRKKAEALASVLSGFGEATVQRGNKAFEVVLRSDGRLSGDKLLQAAWDSGAPDAMTVRD